MAWFVVQNQEGRKGDDSRQGLGNNEMPLRLVGADAGSEPLDRPSESDLQALQSPLLEAAKWWRWLKVQNRGRASLLILGE